MPTIDGQLFRQTLGRYPTGVTVVTANGPDGPAAMVIGSFGSVSLDPPLVMFMPTKTSTSWAKIEAAGHYCANVFGEHQIELTNRFFRKDEDVWEGLEWTTASTGAPVLPGCVAYVDCTIDTVHEAGDHLIVIGAVQDLAAAETENGPLLFYGGGYGRFAPLD